MKALPVLLYAISNISLNGIGRLLGVSDLGRVTFSVLLLAMLTFSVNCKAEVHKECQVPLLNTYQHAKCEEHYANEILKVLIRTNIALKEQGGLLGLMPQVLASQTSFLSFVEKDCRLEADATLGTMGTYLFEECRSSHYKRRVGELRKMLDTFRSMNNHR